MEKLRVFSIDEYVQIKSNLNIACNGDFFQRGSLIPRTKKPALCEIYCKSPTDYNQDSASKHTHVSLLIWCKFDKFCSTKLFLQIKVTNRVGTVPFWTFLPK
eukprot:UN08933